MYLLAQDGSRLCCQDGSPILLAQPSVLTLDLRGTDVAEVRILLKG